MKYFHWFSLIALLSCFLLNACSDEDLPVAVTTRAQISVTDASDSGFLDTPSSTSSNKTRVPGTPKPTPTPLKPAPTKVPTVPPGTLLVELSFSNTGSKISPYIYGLAGTDDTDPNYAKNLKPTLMRWGGNPSSRFNWVLGNAWNAARDFEFRNGDYGNPGKDVATDTIQSTLKQNMAMLLTIPTIGWVAKNSDNNVHSLNVPLNGGPPLRFGVDEISGYNPAANRALTSVKSEPRKNAPFVTKPDPAGPVVYQDEWVASLVKRFGPASAGGVKFYAMDNEPDLWFYTHTDVAPVQWGYDDLVSRFSAYASAVKDVDPSSEILGPVSWGWTGYFYSPLDQGNDTYKTAAERGRHGNVPLIPWFLDQMRQYELGPLIE